MVYGRMTVAESIRYRQLEKRLSDEALFGLPLSCHRKKSAE